MSLSASGLELHDVLIKNDDLKPANFENAIKATGFGKFNLLLMCIAIPCSFVQIMEQISTSFVSPIAQCDLELSLKDKGILNSASYSGMMVTSIIWGYICDTYGRRKVIVYGCLLNSLCYVAASFSQTFTMLVTARFLCGAMFTGPFSAVTSYISEFHTSSKRAVVQLVRGTTGSLAMIVLPLLGWAILPTGAKFFITKDFVLKSWNIFLLICSLPAFITAIIFIFMPESPKFLMTQGKNEEALQVFQMVHRINLGESHRYPITCLMEEKQRFKDGKESLSVQKRLKNSFKSLKPLFCYPYIITLILVCFNILALVMGIFGLKLWYPQLLQSINDYEMEFGSHNMSICRVIESMTMKQNNSGDNHCTVNLDNSYVYINASILGVTHMSVFIIAGFIVNKLGKKTLVVILTSFTAVCPMLMYFISNKIVMAAVFPIVLAVGELSGNILLTTTMELFPTTFRLTALNIHLLFVRIATSVANVLFPYLLMSGCLAILLFLTICVFITAILTSLFPTTENKALE